MVRGTVFGGQAIVSLRVADSGGTVSEMDFVIDTGFVGFLVLPPAAIAKLNPTWLNTTFAKLAGNVRVEADAFEVVVAWNEEVITVEAIMLDGDPMIGMSMLRGSELRMHVEDGGLVEIDPV